MKPRPHLLLFRNVILSAALAAAGASLSGCHKRSSSQKAAVPAPVVSVPVQVKSSDTGPSGASGSVPVAPIPSARPTSQASAPPNQTLSPPSAAQNAAPMAALTAKPPKDLLKMIKEKGPKNPQPPLPK